MDQTRKRTFITVEVPQSLYNQLTLHATACGVKRSEVIRWALVEYVERFQQALRNRAGMNGGVTHDAK